jgi:parallel beta-helix repeat protein
VWRVPKTFFFVRTWKIAYKRSSMNLKFTSKKQESTTRKYNVKPPIFVRRGHSRLVLMSAAAALLILPVLPLVQVQAIVCSPAGTTGLTAKIVATPSGQTISGLTIDATGCDIGVYVGPGIVNVTISGNTISGANDHGIFIQDSSGDTVSGNTVQGNGGPGRHACPMGVTTGCILEDKAIGLAGTSSSTVSGNLVSNNMADGGISISDDGAIDPGAPNAGNANPGNNNLVLGNTVSNNAFGCGIVAASYNAGEGVSGNIIGGNSVTTGPTVSVPLVGGIVLADDTPGTSGTHELSSNNQILNNFISGGLIPGIIVHANAPFDDVVNTLIQGNAVSGNGFLGGPFDAGMPVGINVVAEVPGLATITGTNLNLNSVSSDYYGLWYCNTTPAYAGNTFSTTVPVGTCPTTRGVPEFPFGMFIVVAAALMLLLVIRKRAVGLLPGGESF